MTIHETAETWDLATMRFYCTSALKKKRAARLKTDIDHAHSTIAKPWGRERHDLIALGHRD